MYGNLIEFVKNSNFFIDSELLMTIAEADLLGYHGECNIFGLEIRRKVPTNTVLYHTMIEISQASYTPTQYPSC
jgi:hypothetical protein